ncbi:MAG: hypothetical protein HS129_09195 [Leptospiraceae bacterium]|nr:hypothetical protein [Leptospiraceae bacterium]
MILEHFSMELKRVFCGTEVNAYTWNDLEERYFLQEFNRKYLSGSSSSQRSFSGIATAVNPSTVVERKKFTLRR